MSFNWEVDFSRLEVFQDVEAYVDADVERRFEFVDVKHLGQHAVRASQIKNRLLIFQVFQDEGPSEVVRRIVSVDYAAVFCPFNIKLSLVDFAQSFFNSPSINMIRFRRPSGEYR